MDANSAARLSEVHPILADKIRQLAALFEAKCDGYELRVTQGHRTWATQHALYLQGRATLPDVNSCRFNCGLAAIPADQNKRVTNADQGESWHNYGLAVDCAPFKGGIPVWDDANPVWGEIVALGASVGLTSGKSWGDEPHFQYTGRFPTAKPDDEARDLWQQGHEALWAEIT